MTIGLGLGLIGSAFTIFNAYLFADRPAQPTRAYSLIWETEGLRRQRFRLMDYEALQPEARRLAELAATRNASFREEDVTTQGLLVTGNYFEMLGAAGVGRLLRPDDAAARGGATSR